MVFDYKLSSPNDCLMYIGYRHIVYKKTDTLTNGGLVSSVEDVKAAKSRVNGLRPRSDLILSRAGTRWRPFIWICSRPT